MSDRLAATVGANNVPAIVRYISGYIQGAHKAYPGIKVLANYANDPTFADQAKCHETALNQINQGSHVVFQVALDHLDRQPQVGAGASRSMPRSR